MRKGEGDDDGRTEAGAVKVQLKKVTPIIELSSSAPRLLTRAVWDRWYLDHLPPSVSRSLTT